MIQQMLHRLPVRCAEIAPCSFELNLQPAITKELYHALEKRHPFSAFRYAAESTGVIQQWYQWRDHWQNEQAEEWMHENGVDFKDGKIVADGKHTFVWSWKDE